jgi:hypothetical protein
VPFSTVTFNWNVDPLDVEVLYPTDQTNLTGDTVSLPPIYAITSDGSALTYTATGLPTGLSIDRSSGTISGTIESGAASSTPYQVTVTATQSAASLTVSQTINWTVSELLIASIPDQVNLPGDTVSLSPSYGDVTGGTPTYTATGLPSGLTIDSSTGTISGTIASNAASSSPYSVTVTAVDGGVSATQSFSWSVQNVILTNPPDQLNADGDSVSLAITASAMAGHTATFSATGLPGGLSINTSTGTISGTVASNADAGGPYSVSVMVTDATSNTSVTNTFTWDISQAVASNQPGAFVAIPDPLTPYQRRLTNLLVRTQNNTAALQAEMAVIRVRIGYYSGLIAAAIGANTSGSNGAPLLALKTQLDILLSDLNKRSRAISNNQGIITDLQRRLNSPFQPWQ